MSVDLSDLDILVLSLSAVALGMFFLVKGGDWTVDSSVYVAHKMNISPMVVGFTILAFGTSFPELLASATANLKGAPGIAIGNVLGSNVANILMVCGATAILTPLIANPKVLFRDTIIMLLCTAVLTGLMLTDHLDRWVGLGLFLALLIYTYVKYRIATQDAKNNKKKTKKAALEEEDDLAFESMKKALLFLLAGLVIISFGADLLVRGSVVTARLLGVPELVIGLSIIAIGTSLPELSTCFSAAKKGHTDVVLGNIIGSNIFNILMIIGICIFIKPIAMGDIDPRAVTLDVRVTLGVMVLFSLWIMIFKKIGKVSGSVFVFFYIVYIALQYKSAAFG